MADVRKTYEGEAAAACQRIDLLRSLPSIQIKAPFPSDGRPSFFTIQSKEVAFHFVLSVPLVFGLMKRPCKSIFMRDENHITGR